MKKQIFAAALSFMLLPHSAQSTPLSLTRSFSDRAATFIPTRGSALAPFAHIRFCVKNPSDCMTAEQPTTVQLDDEMRAQLRTINTSVNKTIRPVNDSDGPAGDVWEAGVAYGDCEDFALTKRRALISAGWPSSALRMAIGYTTRGEGHAVLVVSTSEGDLVLDNMTTAIRPWNRTGIRLTKIQSGTNPRLWLSV